MRRLLPLVLLLMLSACARPNSYEQFVRSDGTGEYSFTLDFADTLQGCDISFYTAIDRPLLRDTLVSFPLKVVWRAPSGRYFSETVYYPADSIRVLYRSGLVPSEAGDWTLSVSINPEPAGLRGLGIICSRKASVAE
ncbi:MAG: hypothetical protein J6Y45_01105 [Bacteroidales bacterium]|nr:hypothetical protein [Bacteroidales bacterium]